MIDHMTFGDRLKKIRTDRGLTQEEFAKLLETSKQVISRYENNVRNPKLKTVEEFAIKLEVPFSQFISERVKALETPE